MLLPGFVLVTASRAFVTAEQRGEIPKAIRPAVVNRPLPRLQTRGQGVKDAGTDFEAELCFRR